jgi:3-isopropylmalate/(R)-2-methylmalate dehydratase small subunit
MDKFTTLSGIAAPMPLVNIDTDMIIPKQFLKTIKRSGPGVNLFDEMRYNQDGRRSPPSSLNQPAYRQATILSRATTSAAAPRASMRPGRSPTSASAA